MEKFSKFVVLVMEFFGVKVNSFFVENIVLMTTITAVVFSVIGVLIALVNTIESMEVKYFTKKKKSFKINM